MTRRKIFIYLFFFLAVTPLFSEEKKSLTNTDVKQVMSQLLELHVDQRAMNDQIVTRSIKIYLENFDPTHSYFLSKETNAYLHPKRSMINQILAAYDKDNYEVYFSLDQRIQQAISRARAWRQEWEQDPEALVAEAKALTPQKRSRPPAYPTRLHDLKHRHRQQLLRLMAFQMEQIDGDFPNSKASRLVALCERQLCQLENRYLGATDHGKTLKKEEADHLVYLRVLKALAASLDAHTAYYSPEEAYAMKVQLEKGMCGIGVVLNEGIDGISVADVLKGGPAAKPSGLQEGDLLLVIDGTPTDELSFRQVLDLLKGAEGSQTRLLVERDQEKLQVELTRAKIVLEGKRVDVSYEPYGDGIIGTLTLHSFYEGGDGISSEKDMRQAIRELEKVGPLKGLVFDMRNNSGGFLSQAVRVSGLFIKSGVVVISKYSDGTMRYFRAVDGTTAFDGPMVVLISRGSASAAEIVAQTLQDYGVAIVAGDEQTYGKGTIQHQTVTSGSAASFFKVTIGKFYTVSGKSTQIEGVKSDIVLPTKLGYEQIGEVYLDYPLPADRVPAAFEDPLTDIDPYARRWFVNYYSQSIQPRIDTWRTMVPRLRENSNTRLEKNENYKLFIDVAKKEVEKGDWGQNDLQMHEAVNIVKDMILLRPSE